MDRRHNAKMVEDLRRELTGGALELLVGAGPSIGSGLPDWNRLNLRLLSRFLEEEYRDLEFQEQDLVRMSELFVGSFGREPVVDLVRGRVTPAKFARMLRSALYGAEPFEPDSLHYEIAAMAAEVHRRTGRARILTFNFDTLLEDAIERLVGTATRIDVVHLHGTLPRQNSSERRSTRSLVLSERDYHVALSQGDWAMEKLSSVLSDPGKTVLLVGLSMTDQRLRSALLHRAASKRRARVVAILPEPQAPHGADLTERIAFSFIREHAVDFWRSWDVEVVWVDNHELVAHHLRRIRLGSSGAAWTNAGRRFLADPASYGSDAPDPRPYSIIYRPDVQEVIVELLRASLRRLRQRFGVHRDEVLQVGGFIPWGGGVLRLGFHYRGGRIGDDVVDEPYARLRELRVQDIENPQGAAGVSYTRGTTLETPADAALMDRNFTREMRTRWSPKFPVRSLLCVPVYASRRWVPVGVMYLASARGEPFWGAIEPNEYDALEQFMRSLFRECLRYRPIGTR